MRATTLNVGPLVTASANNIALSQTPTAAFTLNGSTAGALDTARRVLFTQAASEAGKSFTITGTDTNGSVQTEVLPAAASATTVQSVLDYKTVTSISISAGATGAITVGTSGVASSRWMRLDEWAPAAASIQVTTSGTVDCTIEQTMQDVNSPTNPVLPYLVQWTPSPDPGVVDATATIGSSFTNSPLWVRLTLNSGSGSASAVISQNASVAY